MERTGFIPEGKIVTSGQKLKNQLERMRAAYINRVLGCEPYWQNIFFRFSSLKLTGGEVGLVLSSPQLKNRTVRKTVWHRILHETSSLVENPAVTVPELMSRWVVREHSEVLTYLFWDGFPHLDEPTKRKVLAEWMWRCDKIPTELFPWHIMWREAENAHEHWKILTTGLKMYFTRYQYKKPSPVARELDEQICHINTLSIQETYRRHMDMYPEHLSELRKEWRENLERLTRLIQNDSTIEREKWDELWGAEWRGLWYGLAFIGSGEEEEALLRLVEAQLKPDRWWQLDVRGRRAMANWRPEKAATRRQLSEIWRQRPPRLLTLPHEDEDYRWLSILNLEDREPKVMAWVRKRLAYPNRSALLEAFQYWKPVSLQTRKTLWKLWRKYALRDMKPGSMNLSEKKLVWKLAFEVRPDDRAFLELANRYLTTEQNLNVLEVIHECLREITVGMRKNNEWERRRKERRMVFDMTSRHLLGKANLSWDERFKLLELMLDTFSPDMTIGFLSKKTETVQAVLRKLGEYGRNEADRVQHLKTFFEHLGRWWMKDIELWKENPDDRSLAENRVPGGNEKIQRNVIRKILEGRRKILEQMGKMLVDGLQADFFNEKEAALETINAIEQLEWRMFSYPELMTHLRQMLEKETAPQLFLGAALLAGRVARRMGVKQEIELWNFLWQKTGDEKICKAAELARHELLFCHLADRLHCRNLSNEDISGQDMDWVVRILRTTIHLFPEPGNKMQTEEAKVAEQIPKKSFWETLVDELRPKWQPGLAGKSMKTSTIRGRKAKWVTKRTG